LLCLLVVTLCAVSLVGCSEDDPGDQAGDIALWLDQAPSAVQDDGDELAVLAALVEQGEEAGGDEISATFKEPVTIKRVELECFGDGSVEGLFGLTSAAGAVDTTSARASCAEGVLELDIPESSREGVTKVSFSSVASTEKGAWRVIVQIGDRPSAWALASQLRAAPTPATRIPVPNPIMIVMVRKGRLPTWTLPRFLRLKA
jgi:hypothetical protein